MLGVQKHHKGKREKKEDQKKVSEELLLATGCLNEDQYFEKHAEFSTWLIEEKEMFFNGVYTRVLNSVIH